MSDVEQEKKIRRENDRLKKENDKLKRQIEKTQREKEEVLKEKERIEKEKKRIEKEYEEYKMRHPETVGVKNGKAYVIKTKTKSSKRKKVGAKKGHRPFNRKMPLSIDKIEKVAVTVCPFCGGCNLSEVAQEERERTVEDIVIQRKPVVTKKIIERRYCRDCKKLVENSVTDALPKARIGLTTMLLVFYLKIGLRTPEESVRMLLDNVFGISISKGEVNLILEQLSKAFGPYYDEMVNDLRNAPARYIDETSWRIDGENVWLWGFITKYEAIYKIDSSRGHEVPLNVLGKYHKGVDVHDRHSAYKALAKKTKNLQQDCWAHFIQNAKELSEFRKEEGGYILEVLKDIYEKAVNYEHKGTDEDIEDLYENLKDRLDIPYKSMKCHKFVVNLLKEKSNLFEFVRNPYVNATNNRAERGLRHSVIARKISGGSRSWKGAKIYEILTSVYHTLSLRGLDIFQHGPIILQTSHG